MQKKKILIFADYFLPGYKAGGPIVSINNLMQLLKDKYNFYLITRNKDWGETIVYTDITPNIWYNKDGIHIQYLDNQAINRKNILRLINENKPDKIYLNSLYSIFTVYTLINKITNKINYPVIVAPRGELNQGAMNSKKWKKKVYVSLLQLLRVGKKVEWQTTSLQEAENVQSFFKEAKIKMVNNIPNQVNFTPPIIEKTSNNLRLIFLSRVDKVKNLVFIIKQLKKIKTPISLDIYGAIKNSVYWKECESVISEVEENIKIEYKGDVIYSKVLPTISSYHFFVLPTLGENFGHAIFEAMLAGTPPLISDNTPWERLEEQKIGWDTALNQENKWEEILIKCAKMNQKTYNEWSKNAHFFAIKFRKSPEIIQQAEMLFE